MSAGRMFDSEANRVIAEDVRFSSRSDVHGQPPPMAPAATSLAEGRCLVPLVLRPMEAQVLT